MENNFSIMSMHGLYPIYGASYAGNPIDNTMIFITKKVEYLIEGLYESKNCQVFAQNGMQVPDELQKNHDFFFSDNPQLDYARYAIQFDEELKKMESVYPYQLQDGGYYIGHNVNIGKDAYIEPGVVIGHNVTIGDHAVIHAGAVIKNAIIGDYALINEYAVIGANGFTMASDERGEMLRIPSLGSVKIGNHVEIGAHDAICRGSGGPTILEDFVKIDTLVHIGHDCHICENVEIITGVKVGGFCKINKHAYIGIGAVLRNRITLGENCKVGMGANVTKSFGGNITIVGNPARVFDYRGNV